MMRGVGVARGVGAVQLNRSSCRQVRCENGSDLPVGRVLAHNSVGMCAVCVSDAGWHA